MASGIALEIHVVLQEARQQERSRTTVEAKPKNYQRIFTILP